MAGICEFADQRSDFGSYNILAPGEENNEVDNYLLVSVDGIGFVVIRQSIDIGGQ